MNILSEIWSSLSRNRFRTAMTGFAVAWGIFMLIVLLGASSGLEHAMRSEVEGEMKNKVDIYAGWATKPYKGLRADRDIHFSERDLLTLRSLPFVENFSAISGSMGNVSEEGYTIGYINGVEANYGRAFGVTILKGRFINEIDLAQKRKVCVVDEAILNELGGKDLVGKTIQIKGINCLVVGVSEKNSGPFARSGRVFIPLSTYDALFSPDHLYDQVVFSVKEEYYSNHTPDDLEKSLRHLLSPSMLFDEEDENALYVSNDKKGNAWMSKIIHGIQLFILIIGWLMLVSGVVGVSNIMLVSVRERTKEFGIRKAIGAPPRTILLMVLGESMIITLLFGFIGVYMGALVVALIDALVPESMFFKNPSVDVSMIIIAFVTLVVAGSLAGLTPAIRSMRIKPIEALNYEK
ncbi:MAG: ABC transporter permease [Paludibacteraceae bacterium]|nr:ABC transporter permease [Paludibacteraceae bacterium]MBQ2190336.1 ABC transporter permease [Paludibacteraceae bacterium]MBQ2520619.1 ABC transporter permease [Paludibacteraceae bacterium]MBQ4019034.1 ABC transporter permease [Paludibacteraceae bacterium]